MELSFSVYVLFSEKDKLFYIGYSGNLKQRLEAHHKGEAKSTCFRRPLRLIFCEFYLFKQDALKREKYFKTTMGKKALRLMLGSTIEKIGYKMQEFTILNEVDEDHFTLDHEKSLDNRLVK
jgi:putative endonuclease